MNNCKIIFSILDSNSFNINELLFILFFTFIILIISFSIKKYFVQKIIGIIAFLAIVSMSISGTIESYSQINSFKKLYKSKKYKEILGTISNFKERKIKSGYIIDSFKIKDIEFEFTNIENTGGYNLTKREGGILDNNQIVKIRYLNRHTNNTKNIILYIEMCKSIDSIAESIGVKRDRGDKTEGTGERNRTIICPQIALASYDILSRNT